MPRRTCYGFTAAVGMLLSAVALEAQVSRLNHDEDIVFYPAMALQADEGGPWNVQIRGCVFEPESRRATLALFRAGLGFGDIHLSPAEDATFTERARLFMADHKRGRKIAVRVGSATFVLNKSGPDGMFSGVVQLTEQEAERLGTESAPIRAILPPNDPRVFSGEVLFVRPKGITVISDIDDTIKITGMADRSAMLRRTFLEAFEPVPGMAELYRSWAEQKGARFSYVSASPWQLFEPLRQFVRSNSFPAGSFELKNFRLKDKTRFSLFEGPERHKSAVISSIIERFPERRFVLIGDSGERDPEIYAGLARRYPRQVIRVFIRALTDPPATITRCQELFQDSSAVWQVFKDPTELEFAAPPAAE